MGTFCFVSGPGFLLANPVAVVHIRTVGTFQYFSPEQKKFCVALWSGAYTVKALNMCITYSAKQKSHRSCRYFDLRANTNGFSVRMHVPLRTGDIFSIVSSLLLLLLITEYKTNDPPAKFSITSPIYVDVVHSVQIYIYNRYRNNTFDIYL